MYTERSSYHVRASHSEKRVRKGHSKTLVDVLIVTLFIFLEVGMQLVGMQLVGMQLVWHAAGL